MTVGCPQRLVLRCCFSEEYTIYHYIPCCSALFDAVFSHEHHHHHHLH